MELLSISIQLTTIWTEEAEKNERLELLAMFPD